MRFFVTFFVFLFVTVNFSFSQVVEVYQGKVGDFIKCSTSFKDGFIFSTPRKIFYFDIKTKKLTELTQISGKVNSIITSLFSYSNYLFVGSASGVFVFLDNFSFYTYIGTNEGLKDLNTTSLFADDRFLYIGTRFNGVYLFDYKTKVLQKLPFSVIDGLVDNFVRNMFLTSFDKVIASPNGFSVFDYVSYLFLPYSSREYPVLSESVFCVLPYGETIFIGSSLGLFAFDRRTENLSKTVFTSPVFSFSQIGNNLIMATYDGVVLYGVNNQSISYLSSTLVADTISVNGNKIFSGFDTKEGNFIIYEYQEPFLKLSSLTFPSKGNVQIILDSYKVEKIKNISLSLTSLNIGRKIDVNVNSFKSANNIIINFSVTNIPDDTYILTISYFNGTKIEMIKDILIVDNYPPNPSFSPIPLFYNQKSLTLIGKLQNSDINYVNLFVNKEKVQVELNLTEKKIISTIPLIEGSNKIDVVMGDNFNNVVTNSFLCIVDMVSPSIVSMDGDVLVERDDGFQVKVIDRYVDRVVFSEKVSNLVDGTEFDGKVYKFSFVDRNIQKVKVIAYDKAGNTSSREFNVKFLDLSGSIVLDAPTTTKVSNVSLKVSFQGNFSKAFVYKQGIIIASLGSVKNFVTNISLDVGKNFIKVEGFLDKGGIISESRVIEYVPEVSYQYSQVYPSKNESATSLDKLRVELNKLRKENEELKIKLAELEEYIKKMTEGKEVKTVVVKQSTIYDLSSIVKVNYDPSVDSFSKISKKLYGSESFSSYFYYLLKGTSVSSIVVEKGLLVLPSKKLMESIVKFGDMEIFEVISTLIEYQINRELGKSVNLYSLLKDKNVSISGNKISFKGITITFSLAKDGILVSLK